MVADFFDRAGDGTHRDDNAQNGGDDPEAGHRICCLGQHADRLVVLFLHRVELHIDQRLQLVGLHFAVNDRPQCAAQQFNRVMILGEGRILDENGAALGVHYMLFQRDHAVAPAEHEEFVECAEEFLVGLAGVGRAFQHSQYLFDQVHQHLFGRHDHQCAKGRTADDDVFRNLDERTGMTTGHHEAPQHRAQNNQCPDDYNHIKNPLGAAGYDSSALCFCR